MKLLLSTSNEDKTHELKSLLEPLGHTVYTLKDYGLKIRVEAKGITFFQNALLKAQAVSKVVDIPVLGDESGLVVPALNGEPGVYSARYAGEVHNSVANIQLLLRKMETSPTARLICRPSSCLCIPTDSITMAKVRSGARSRVRAAVSTASVTTACFIRRNSKRLLPRRPLSKSNRSAIVCRRSTICSEKSTQTLAR